MLTKEMGKNRKRFKMMNKHIQDIRWKTYTRIIETRYTPVFITLTIEHHMMHHIIILLIPLNIKYSSIGPHSWLLFIIPWYDNYIFLNVKNTDNNLCCEPHTIKFHLLLYICKLIKYGPWDFQYKTICEILNKF